MIQYAEKPSDGDTELLVREKIAEGDLLQAQHIKCDALISVGNISFTYESVLFEILEMSKKETGDKVMFEVKIKVTKDGEVVNVSDNRLQFIDPPILCHNGTYRKETVEGSSVNIPNMHEDLECTLKEIIIKTVKKHSNIF